MQRNGKTAMSVTEAKEKNIANTKYKDRLFVWLFGREENKHNILALYNALHHTHYTDPNLLEINTIENAVYITMHNDVSFLLSENMLNLWEEQSTFNPNMPIRGLMYLAQLYSSYIDKHKLNIYGQTRFDLPVPQYIVFYLGDKEEPDRLELRLTDSFPARERTDFQPCVEMTATMLNINAGHNKELLEGCRVLREYSQLVQIVREHVENDSMTPEEAIEKAVDECIANDILADELRSNKAEVIGMLLAEYDENKKRELFLAEGRAEGKVNELAGLVHDGDLSMSVAQNRAWKKYGISREAFQKMVETYDSSEELDKVPVETKRK